MEISIQNYCHGGQIKLLTHNIFHSPTSLGDNSSSSHSSSSEKIIQIMIKKQTYVVGSGSMPQYKFVS